VNDQRYIYQAYTLIDITPTGQTVYSRERELERNQQRNWETVLQLINLRTQTEIIETSDTVKNIKDLNQVFGINYTGLHKIWSFKFSVDYAEIYRDGADSYGLLKSDFKLTPIILDLTETAEPEMPLFYTSGPWKNVYFNQTTN
jgi:hypothetical protein